MATISYCPFCGTPCAETTDLCGGCGRSAADRLSVTTETEALPPTQLVSTVTPEEVGVDDPTQGIGRDKLMKGDTAPLGGAPKVVRHTPTLGSLRPPQRRGAGLGSAGAIAGEALVEAVIDHDVKDTHEVDVSPTYNEALRSEARAVGKAPDREALAMANLPTRALPSAPRAEAAPTQLVDAVPALPEEGEEDEAPRSSAGLMLLAAGLGVTALFGVVVVAALALLPSAQTGPDPSALETDAAPPTAAAGPAGAAATGADGVAGGEVDAGTHRVDSDDSGPANSGSAGADAASGGEVAGASPASKPLQAPVSKPSVRPSATQNKGGAAEGDKAADSAAKPAAAAEKPTGSAAKPASVPAKPALAAAKPAASPVSRPSRQPAVRPAEGLPPDKLVDVIFVNPEAVKPPWVHRTVPHGPARWGGVRMGGIDAVVVPAEGVRSAQERSLELVETFQVLIAAHREAGGGEVLIVGIAETPWLVWRAPTGASGPRALEIMPLDDADLSAMRRFETRESLVRRWGQLPALLTDLLDLVALGHVPSRLSDPRWLAAADAWLAADGGRLAPEDLGALNRPAWRTR